ncbi:unnamed protein product [Didymodactylos carnosus]|nr:unnamed protein product [Didymodactylos carnosus]CAF4127750.1 unnamed protein product [Didymodactylos carnosus]
MTIDGSTKIEKENETPVTSTRPEEGNFLTNFFQKLSSPFTAKNIDDANDTLKDGGFENLDDNLVATTRSAPIKTEIKNISKQKRKSVENVGANSDLLSKFKGLFGSDRRSSIPSATKSDVITSSAAAPAKEKESDDVGILKLFTGIFTPSSTTATTSVPTTTTLTTTASADNGTALQTSISTAKPAIDSDFLTKIKSVFVSDNPTAPAQTTSAENANPVNAFSESTTVDEKKFVSATEQDLPTRLKNFYEELGEESSVVLGQLKNEELFNMRKTRAHQYKRTLSMANDSKN